MKDLRLLQKLFFLFLVGFSLCTVQACGGDDEDDERIEEPTNKDDEGENVPSTPEGSKRLVKIVEEEFEVKDGYTDEGIRTYTFKYDNQGNVIHVSNYQSEYDYEEFSNFKYTEDSITFDSDLGYFNEKVTFELSDDKICYAKREGRYSNWEFNFEYNSHGLLTQSNQYEGSDQYLTNLIWEDYKLMESEEKSKYESESITFKYGNNTCKGYNPIIVFNYINVFTPIVAKPELLGLRTNQLPTSMEEDGDIQTFTYELDEDGYLKKCEAVWNDGEESSIYTFTWE